jgi:Tfp pilus assembly protein PilO
MGTNWKKDYQRYKSIIIKNYEYYKKREDIKNYIEIVLSLIAIIVFSVFAIRPTAITIVDLNKEIKAKEETIKKMNTKLKNLQEAQDFLNQQQETISLLDKAIPEDPQAERFVQALEKIANTNNNKIKNINTENITLLGETREIKRNNLVSNLPQGTVMIPFSMSLSGEFKNLKNTIKDLENFLRPSLIENLTILKPQTEEESGNLNMNMVINAPYYQTNKSQNPPENNKQKENQEENN